jgi:hypothetical protein
MDETILAQDQINIIKDWLDYAEKALENENISLATIVDIESIYEIVKE